MITWALLLHFQHPLYHAKTNVHRIYCNNTAPTVHSHRESSQLSRECCHPLECEHCQVPPSFMTSHTTSIPRILILLFLAFRILNSLLIETFHVPDEYWQSIEVAHRAVFGYGFLTWEWQPSATLRSFLHPALFAAAYRVIDWISLDAVWPASVVIVPKLVQALFAALGDVCLYLFVRRNHAHANAIWYTIINFTNWFLLHNLTRTLANSIETTLFSVFLCYWPVYPGRHGLSHSTEAHIIMRNRRRVALFCAGVCFLLRPTSAITWAFFALSHLYDTQHKREFLLEASLISTFVLALGALVDIAYYGRFVSPLLSFMRFNFLSSGAAHYGSHPWYWYVLHGIPTLLGPYTVPLLFSLRKRSTFHNPFSWLIATNVFFFSIIGHKEARFLMPLIPVFHIIIATTISHWLHPVPIISAPSSRNPSPSEHITSTPPVNVGNSITASSTTGERRSSPQKSVRPSRRLRWIAVLLMILSSLAIAFYTCHVHQRGTLDLMTWIREYEEVNEMLLLMPCHHTPGLAFIHRPNFRLEYLDCSPGLPSGKLGEADVFFENPVLFLQERYSLTQYDPITNTGSTTSTHGNQIPHHPLRTFVTNPPYGKDSGQNFSTISTPLTHRPLPSHIAMYNALLSEDARVQSWLTQHHYEAVASFFHAHVADGRMGTHVLLFGRKPSH